MKRKEAKQLCEQGFKFVHVNGTPRVFTWENDSKHDEQGKVFGWATWLDDDGNKQKTSYRRNRVIEFLKEGYWIVIQHDEPEEELIDLVVIFV